MEESEAWRKEGDEKPWTEVIETNERFVLQLDIRELGTMMTMLGSNLVTANIEDTKEKSIKLVEKFIERWKYIEK
ncbi:hypothetical protein EB155_09280 [archaeon]|nr:hypothetical protein [archaeon]